MDIAAEYRVAHLDTAAVRTTGMNVEAGCTDCSGADCIDSALAAGKVAGHTVAVDILAGMEAEVMRMV